MPHCYTAVSGCSQLFQKARMDDEGSGEKPALTRALHRWSVKLRSRLTEHLLSLSMPAALIGYAACLVVGTKISRYNIGLNVQRDRTLKGAVR